MGGSNYRKMVLESQIGIWIGQQVWLRSLHGRYLRALSENDKVYAEIISWSWVTEKATQVSERPAGINWPGNNFCISEAFGDPPVECYISQLTYQGLERSGDLDKAIQLGTSKAGTRVKHLHFLREPQKKKKLSSITGSFENILPQMQDGNIRNQGYTSCPSSWREAVTITLSTWWDLESLGDKPMGVCVCGRNFVD